MEEDQTSNLLKLTRNLFYLNAAVWLVFGLLSLFFRAIHDGSLVRWVITVMMIVNAMIMFWFGVMIVRRQNWVFFLAFLFTALNVVLSITDQFGWIDAIILVLNVCLLGLLLVTRHRMNRVASVS